MSLDKKVKSTLLQKNNVTWTVAEDHFMVSSLPVICPTSNLGIRDKDTLEKLNKSLIPIA